MSVIGDIIDTIHSDAPVSEIRTCVFWTAVVTEGQPVRCGLASTLRQPYHESVSECGDLFRYTAKQLTELAHSEKVLDAGVGMAAINALLDVDEARCVEVNARDLVFERGKGKNIVVVGHFPFVEDAKKIAKSCWVLEQQPRAGDLAADQAASVLPDADVVALSGTSIMNHTFEELIKLCSPEAFVVLLGPSTPLSPVLFEYGVDVIAGTQVVDIDTTLRCISQGATFRQVKGVKLLTMTK